MIAGIDIGTSYSSICIQDETGKVQPVDTATGTSMYGSKYSLPSAVFVEDNGNVLVGQAAMNNRRNKPGQFCMEFKRNIGQDIPVFLGDYSYTPEELYREIFIHMKNCVKKSYGKDIAKACVTCPASFGKKKREKVLAAAKAAGLFDVELVDEPTDAAQSYLDQKLLSDGQTILLYDFGGGTFDVSVLSYKNGSFALLAEPGGIEQCGGIDIDRRIYQDMLSHIAPEILQQIKENTLYKMRFQCQLGELAVKIKHQLSSACQCKEFIPVGWESVPYTLTVDHFNEMAAPLIAQTIAACRSALKAAGLSVSELSAVFMVGGTSRIPLVREMVGQFAKNVPVYSSVDLELAVAMGALQAENSSVEPDELKEFRALAEQGDADGQYWLGRFYKDGIGVLQNYTEAMKWFHKAAKQGNDAAQFDIGLCYEEGKGVDQDYIEAAKWFHKAAKQGNGAAQFNIGLYYERGKGVNQDYIEAVKWYRKAAEQGVASAQNNLGSCYYNGTGVACDYDEAVRWFFKAAGQGEANAQCNLGLCYENGYGVPKDQRQAEYWYNKAKEQ